MIIDLNYLDKTYRGGRLANIHTFCNVCDDKKKADAQWKVDTTIQSGESTTDGFAVIALGQLLQTPVIFKIMDDSWRSKKEKRVHKVFRMYPHRNIVQSICEFNCKDNTVRWLKKLEAPQILCDTKGDSKFTIIIQEFIEGSDLSKIEDWTFPLWKSVTLQLMFTSIELFDRLGFIYEDWNLRNILADTTSDKVLNYKAYGKTWKVTDSCGISPVFTDFSRSDILLEKKKDWHLAVQLSHCLDMMKNSCHNRRMKKIVIDYSVKIELFENIDDILDCVVDFMKELA